MNRASRSILQTDASLMPSRTHHCPISDARIVIQQSMMIATSQKGLCSLLCIARVKHVSLAPSLSLPLHREVTWGDGSRELCCCRGVNSSCSRLLCGSMSSLRCSCMIVELIDLAADRMVTFDCQWSVFIRDLVSTDDWANNTALYVYELI